MNLSETRKGELAILAEALLWSIFPIITILSYTSLNPVTSLAWSTLFASVFFGFVMLIKSKTREIFNPQIWPMILLPVFFVGWMYYGLYFLGLKFTTAGNASIIALMELFFSYLFFNIWKKQDFSKAHTFGAVLMLFGAVIVLFPKQGLSFHGGDFLVLLATAFAPVGNYYQQKLRKIVSSETILFLRSLLTFPFAFLLGLFLRAEIGPNVIEKYFWLLLLNGFIALGLSKLWWLEGIHRISVTKANALSVVAPLFTLFFAFLILHQVPTIWQLSAFIPMAAGLILLTYEKSTPVVA
jgi:drug/metabolite transporter (DMT)-like permease